MLTIQLIRFLQSPNGTFGVLILDNSPVLVTLEPSEPIIPADHTYQVIPHDSPAHPHTWEISNVPGHTAVLIHNGNTTRDTEGCILVGLGFGQVGGVPAIINSDLALQFARNHFAGNFTLTISNGIMQNNNE